MKDERTWVLKERFKKKLSNGWKPTPLDVKKILETQGGPASKVGQEAPPLRAVLKKKARKQRKARKPRQRTNAEHKNISEIRRIIAEKSLQEVCLIRHTPNHWKIKTLAGVVNYYPRTGTVYLDGEPSGIRKQTPAQALAIAMSTKKAVEIRVAKTSKMAASDPSFGCPRCRICSQHVLITHEVTFIGTRMVHDECFKATKNAESIDAHATPC